jgi:hypothetical protein
MDERVDLPSVDQSAIKVSQACTILLLVVGFVVDLWVLVAAVAIINLMGVVRPALGLWRQLYLKVLRPSGLVRPNVIPDHPEPHRFAQGVGGVLALTATVVLLLGQSAIGWGLVWFHILLAALNLFVGFCLGCFAYYQLNRLGVPGFGRGRIGG